MKILKSRQVWKSIRCMGHMVGKRDQYWLDRIGSREIVGYGLNGQPCYADWADFPFPAIKWKETTPDIQSLNEKAKGDWRLLSKEEKKTLYRANFCQTYAEFLNQPGDWPEVFGWTLVLCSLPIWIYLYLRTFVYGELPESFSPSRRRAQLRRQIDLQMNPIQGLSSEWDYERMDWKRVTWRTPPNPFVVCPDDD
ncbi:hypothetical protein HUJ04_013296 [Dendroctonus ponderosae]